MSKQNDAYFVLAAWCTVAKSWKDGQGRYDSVQDAECAASDPGIYRVAYVNGERRCNLEPFARVPNG